MKALSTNCFGPLERLFWSSQKQKQAGSIIWTQIYKHLIISLRKSCAWVSSKYHLTLYEKGLFGVCYRNIIYGRIVMDPFEMCWLPTVPVFTFQEPDILLVLGWTSLDLKKKHIAFSHLYLKGLLQLYLKGHLHLYLGSLATLLKGTLASLLKGTRAT